MSRLLAIAAAALLASAGCTDASVYSLRGAGANLPDRATFEGLVCVPPTVGRHFPTRVVFAVQGGQVLDPSARAAVAAALGATVERTSSPFVRYGLVAFGDYAFSLLPGGLAERSAFTAALPQYGYFSQPGPPSLTRALALSESLLSGALINDCPGARARGRYTVVLVMFGAQAIPATYCQGLAGDAACRQSAASPPPNAGAVCTRCVVEEQVRAIRNLSERYGAAEVTVQPIYAPLGAVDPAARDQAALVAYHGGTQAVVTDVSGLEGVLGGLGLLGLSEELELRTVLAFNRHARVRAGEVLADSDGDGLPDDDEATLGTDARLADTDLDNLLDGVELVAGLDPRLPDVVKGCDLGFDDDRDGLNSCEERLVGTSDCMGDTDGDGAPDLVELFAGTDPLTGEGTLDVDRDGFPNLEELRRHSDPTSDDLEFVGSRSYTYDWEEVEPPLAGAVTAADAGALPDPCPGQRRYRVEVGNVGLVSTQATDAHETGGNDVYLYAVFALRSGGSLARWQLHPLTFLAPSTRVPPDPVLPIDESACESRP